MFTQYNSLAFLEEEPPKRKKGKKKSVRNSQEYGKGEQSVQHGVAYLAISEQTYKFCRTVYFQLSLTIRRIVGPRKCGQMRTSHVFSYSYVVGQGSQNIIISLAFRRSFVLFSPTGHIKPLHPTLIWKIQVVQKPNKP